MMNNPLVECIPNFSEGRRMDVVDQIADAIGSVSGVQILDRHSDEDHNRSVITILGGPEAVKEAAFSGIEKAAELIDMGQHQGAHPRIGAADVVPFVPIREISIEECVELARELGWRVGEELHIPVYLYEEAAAKPERVNLENIRRGQYEELKKAITDDPERAPDYGPALMGSAGAVVIGAREALIAFNVYLSTDDVSVAKKIAKTIRHSSGGLRYVKAMGVMVEGRAQVSMNLTNFKKTPIALVVETIRREAWHYGTTIHHGELVGLVPQEALLDAAVWYTQLDQFENNQVLENRLSKLAEEDTRAKYQFLDELASSEPTPGGGSAAAFTAAEAAALVAMVARLTLGKEKYADIQKEMKTILDKAEELRKKLAKAVEEDAMVFNSVMRAFKMPKTNEEEKQARKEAIQSASLHAAEISLKTAEMALEVMRLSLVAAGKGNLNAITDAGTAAALAHAAVASAGANVRVNLSGINGEDRAKQILSAMDNTENEAAEMSARIRSEVKKRSGVSML